jgi:hypothetical protein
MKRDAAHWEALAEDEEKLVAAVDDDLLFATRLPA